MTVVIRQPLLLPILQAFSPSDRTPSSLGEMGSSNAASRRSGTIVTAVIGGVFLGDAVAHITLALTLPTGTFLVMSRVVNWTILGSGAALLWWMRRRVGARSKEPASAPNGD